MRPPKDSVRPPQWADALLRLFLKPDRAETESGDLLEAYRDSIYPARGRGRAGLWYVQQVAGYILRASAASRLRNWILAGLTLCILTIAFTVLRYPDEIPAGTLVGITAGVLLYGCIAVWRTRPAHPEEASVLRLGARWGIANGALWSASSVCGNLVIPHRLGAQTAVLLAGVAFLLPFVSGAHGAIKTRRVRDGMRVGFWSGLISGLMAFFALAAVGYILAFVPGLPGAEIPDKDHGYTAAEYERLNVMDALGGALAEFLFGGLLGVIGGTVGGVAGILLERTGRGPDISAPVP